MQKFIDEMRNRVGVILFFLFCMIGLLIFTTINNKNLEGVDVYTKNNVDTYKNEYKVELDYLRKNTERFDMESPELFFFGMGNRTKFVFRDTSLIDIEKGKIVRNFNDVNNIEIMPDEYKVIIEGKKGKNIIYEDENAVWIDSYGKKEKLDSSDCKICLPAFDNYKYSAVLRVLHHEILFNIKNSAVYPNILVYKKPFYRDAFMAALCLEKTNNTDLLIPWIKSINNLYDMQNGEAEADNLGELLYLMSYLPDSPKRKMMVEKIMNEVSRITISKDGDTYIKGKTDGDYNALYPTLILKMALAKNKMKDYFSEEAEECEYDDLCWFWWNKPHRRGLKRWYKDFRFNYLDSPFPYLQWARAHFYDNVKVPFNSGDYPLSWECRGGSADFQGMAIVSKDAVDRKICYPHVWTAAEMFLRLYEYGNR